MKGKLLVGGAEVSVYPIGDVLGDAERNVFGSWTMCRDWVEGQRSETVPCSGACGSVCGPLSVFG